MRYFILRQFVHDPYGMKMPNGYVKNGDGIVAKKARITENNSTFLSRTKYNVSLRGQVNDLINKDDNGTFLGNMGEANFYTWNEVKTYKIGKWINILSKK